MTVASQSPTRHNALPMLIGLRERNVIFVIDTSENMYSMLSSVKDLLVRTLVAKASLRDSLFNLIGYSHKVTKWYDHMVTCCSELVHEAQGWIQALCCSPGRDLLAALSEAFADPSCQAVHLVTNDLLDNPEELLHKLPSVVKTRRLHIFYLSDKGFPDLKTKKYLQCLSLSTRGSCYFLSLSSSGAVEQVRPLYLKELASDVKYCSAGGVHNPPSYWDPCVRQSHPPCRWASPAHACHVYTCGLQEDPLRSSELVSGSRVLAQRELDGFYYLGTIKEEVQGRKGTFLVEFDRPAWTGAPCSSFAPQQTSLANIVPHTEAHQHNLLPGDKVLAPSDVELSRYEPGSVLSGVELWNLLGSKELTVCLGKN